MSKKMLAISAGSMEAAIVKRNAFERLYLSSLDGYFSEIEYIFYRTETSNIHQLENNIRVHDISGNNSENLEAGWLDKLKYFKTGYREIASICDNFQPDLIHVVEPFISGLIGYHLSRKYNIPLHLALVSDYQLSYEVGGLKGIPMLPIQISSYVESFLYSKTDMITVDCEYYKNYAIRRGAKSERVTVVPRFADKIYYNKELDESIWQKFTVEDESPLVYVGRLSPEKYSHDLITAYEIVIRELPNKHLVLIGDGPEKQEIKKRVEQSGLKKKVHFLTGLSKLEIKSAFAKSGVVLVSHGGYALLEAALSGSAVVAYDYEWHPEVIKHGETGYLAEYRNARQLGELALSIIKNTDKANQMRDALHSLAHSKYTIEATIKAQTEVMKKLLEN